MSICYNTAFHMHYLVVQYTQITDTNLQLRGVSVSLKHCFNQLENDTSIDIIYVARSSRSFAILLLSNLCVPQFHFIFNLIGEKMYPITHLFSITW